MTTLVYIPTGLASPELEILLAKTQSAIDLGETTIVVTCAGGAGYACSLNIYGLASICKICKAVTKRGLTRIQGPFQHIETPSNVSDSNYRDRAEILLTRQSIKMFCIDNVDIGQASYSSYIGASRDQDLEGYLARQALGKLVASSEQLLFWIKKILVEKKVSRVVLYNGRQNQYRPVLRVAQQMQIEVDVMEFAGQESRCVYTFKNELPQEIEVLNSYIELTWKRFEGDVKQCGVDYYSLKRSGGVINDSRSYVQKQIVGMLPSDWDFTKHNIVIFNSSEDEFAALGGEYDKTLYKNQTEAITRLCQSVRDDEDLIIWLRIHPNLSKVYWSFAKELLGLPIHYKNVRVIPGNSPVSSYDLLESCNMALSFGSTMGVEATYWGKPSVLIGRSIYEKLAVVYTPQTHDEVVGLIRQRDLKPLSIEGALKAALFWSYGGQSIPYLGGNRKNGFTFRNHKINKTCTEKIIYKLVKIFEKIILGYIVNFGLRHK